VDQEQKPRDRANELLWLLVPDWRPNQEQVLWTIRITVVLGVLIAIGYTYGVTLWDWAQLLIVPAAITSVGIWFNRQQRERELEVAAQHAQDEALQAYLDQMSQLLLDKDRPLRRSEEDAEVRTLARARTLTVLRRLGSERKGSVLQFLYELGLVAKNNPVLALSRADLSEADLLMADLSKADLSGAFLSGAFLSGAFLSGADLRQAHLREAMLFLVDLSEADLFFADLREADLSRADLSEADLLRANLSEADLRRAELRRTDLREANLHGANLREADLRRALVTDEPLAEAKSLKGATMPDGKTLKSDDKPHGLTFEEWLKEKWGRVQDGENSGPS
jgi:uncharacterized protein YjbI with pentapeptide repeats